MECTLCKIQYYGKSETHFNLRLNNHRKDVNNPKAILAFNYFKIHGNNIMKHAKFTLMEQLAEISNVSKETQNTCSQGTKRRQCLKSNNWIFSSFNSHILQLGRTDDIMTYLTGRHYDVKKNLL